MGRPVKRVDVFSLADRYAIHRIVTDSHETISSRRNRVSIHYKNAVDKEIHNMLSLGVIRQSPSAWSSHVVIVEKMNGDIRLFVDYRKLNDVIVKD